MQPGIKALDVAVGNQEVAGAAADDPDMVSPDMRDRNVAAARGG